MLASAVLCRIWMCVLTTHWAEQDVLGNISASRVIMTVWNCHSWMPIQSLGDEKTGGTGFWSAAIVILPPVRYIYITADVLELLHLRRLISSAESSRGDSLKLICNTDCLPLKPSTSTSKLAVPVPPSGLNPIEEHNKNLRSMSKRCGLSSCRHGQV